MVIAILQWQDRNFYHMRHLLSCFSLLLRDDCMDQHFNPVHMTGSEMSIMGIWSQLQILGRGCKREFIPGGGAIMNSYHSAKTWISFRRPIKAEIQFRLYYVRFL